ncbi:MAG: diversity-generating retroelement protein Avd [Pseudomonadota bacterium]
MPEPLVILSRTYDLLAWLLPKGERFPRVYRYTVTRRLLGAAMDLQEDLFQAQARRGELRLRYLQGADAALNSLRSYLRMAHEWAWLNDGQYQHVSLMVAEVGRLLGGWLRQTEAALRERGTSEP